MDTREQRRARLVPALARLVRSRDFRVAFAALGPDQTIIPALPDDTVSYVLDRLGEGNGTGVVAVELDDRIRLAIIMRTTPERRRAAEENDELVLVHGETAVGMFFDCLVQMRTLVVEQVTAKLVDDGEVIACG